jgi:hypothetical protein
MAEEKKEEKKKGGSKKLLIILAVLAVLVIGFFVVLLVLGLLGGLALFQISSVSSVSMGMTDFTDIRPLSHRSGSPGYITILFMNARGTEIEELEVEIDDIDATPHLKETTLSPGETTTLDTKGENTIPTICPENAHNYDVTVEISYTDSLSGLRHTSTGRLWGPC